MSGIGLRWLTAFLAGAVLLWLGITIGRGGSATAPEALRNERAFTRAGAPVQLARPPASPAPQAATQAASGEVHMAVRVDRTAVLKGGDGQLYAELELEAGALPGAEVRAPTDFVVVLDRSGSMAGQKLAFAKQAAEHLLDHLRDDDRFALVVYDDDAQREVALSPATAPARARFHQLVRRIGSGSSTNIARGLDLALMELEAPYEPGRQRRVLLLSDGLANQGDTSPSGLADRARRITGRGAVLTTMGIGDDFDQRLMTALSEAGEGNFYYLARLEALAGFFESELSAASRTVARNVAVHFVPGAYVELLDASGYAIERQAGELRFLPGSLYAGQKRSIWLTLRVPTDRLESFELGSVRLSYERDGAARELSARLEPQIACVAEQLAFRRGIVRDVWERAVRTEEYGKYERKLAEAVAQGSAEDVDRAQRDYASKNQALAAELGSRVVADSVRESEARAVEAKAVQTQAPRAREVAGKRMQAGAKFKRNRDAYLSDPNSGL